MAPRLSMEPSFAAASSMIATARRTPKQKPMSVARTISRALAGACTLGSVMVPSFRVGAVALLREHRRDPQHQVIRQSLQRGAGEPALRPFGPVRFPDP